MYLALSLAFAAQLQAATDVATQVSSAPEPTLAPNNDPEQFTTVALELDDSVPLPLPALVEVADGADRVVAPASGDPYFLGFTAGKYFPPADERVDPELSSALLSHYGDGRPTQETYAFVMFQKRITPERLAQLADLGVRVLEFHPHYCMKVALAPALVDSVSGLDFVRWIGAPKTWQKIHAGMSQSIDALRDGELLEVYINVYDSDLGEASVARRAGTVEFGGPEGVTVVDDPAVGPQVWMSNGWQQRVLQELGVEVYEYVDSIRAFRARIAPAQLEPLSGLDFVQFVEPQGRPELEHDESMAMVLADSTRNTYDGASPAVAGQVDSGIEYSHSGINGYAWWAVNLTGGGEATTDDLCGHGTHVAGTIHGSGAVEDSYEGAANLLGNTTTTRFFNVKHFSGAGCDWSGASISTVLGATDSAVTDGSGDITPRPHVVNHSWGTDAPAGGVFGSEASCRTLDASIYTNTQLQVFAAGNDGPGASTLNIEPSSKNVFAVGGVRDYASGAEDPGEMYTSSGRGPTADSRWKPNISAPATSIRSADADNLTGYVNKSGTSMAAPHVTGVASQLMEHYSFLRHNPVTTGALLMASAMTKDGILLSTPTSTHLDNWGAGRLDAYKAHYGVGGLSFWAWNQGTSSGNFVDVPVSAGATRIAVCMYYHEPAASSGASQALVNDLDLWIDSPAGGISATTNTGEYSAQQSSLDNTEIRLINSPEQGTWRIKVHPDSATSVCRVGIAVLVHYDDVTPDGTLNVTASDLAIQPNDNVSITATAYNPEYIASAVFFDSTSVGDTLQNATGVLEDGASANYMNNFHSGRDVLVGSIRPNDSRSVVWTTRWATEGLKSFSVNARSENWVDKTDSVVIAVDGTPPPLPTNLASSTHTVNQWTNDTTITYTWTQPADTVSGVDGYGLFTSTGAGLPSAAKDMEQGTSFNEVLTQGSWYFNIRPVDNSGNWNASFASVGPFLIDTTNPSAATGLSSSTHQVNVQNCSTSVTVSWNASTDSGGSGFAGYRGVWDTSPATNPVGAVNIGAGSTSFGANIGSSTSARYFHLRSIDTAGNYGVTAHFGPIYANANSVVVYCTGKTNSLGCVPAIATNGVQPSKSVGNFTVSCSQVINQKNGLLFFGFSPASAPFQGGTLCAAPPTIRTPSQSSGGSGAGSDCSGSYSFTFSTAQMNTLGLDPGETVYAQFWMRDPQSPSTTGLSNAVQFTVCN
jgi:hypothetical protein